MQPVNIGLDCALREDMGGLWAKCPSCSRFWMIAALPAPIGEVAELAAAATCPSCGYGRPVVAKQAGGALLEGASK